MTLSKFLFIVGLSTLLLQSCENFSWLPKEQTKDEKEAKEGTKRNGLYTKKSKGVVVSQVNYVDGKKEGKAINFFPNGKEELVLYYKNNIKHGTATTYYESGVVKKETPYVDGVKHGIQKYYFSNGKISAEIPFQNGLQSRKTKEYYKSGKQITDQPRIIVKEIDRLKTSGEYIVTIQFAKKVRNVKFYNGVLQQGEYLDISELGEMDVKQGVARIVLHPAPGTFIMEKLNIVGQYKTNKGTYHIATKVHNLAIENI